MRDFGLGVAVLVLVVSGCGESSAGPSAPHGTAGTGGASASDAGYDAAGGAARDAAGGAAGVGGGAGNDGSPTLTEPDTSESCVPDPLRHKWIVTPLGSIDHRSVGIGVGADLAVLAYGLNGGGMYARTAGADNQWSEAVQLSAGSVDSFWTTIGVSNDGSTAVLLWTEAGNIRASVYARGSGFGSATTLSAVSQELEDVDLAVLSGGRALVAWAGSSGISTLEYDAARGFQPGATLATNFEAMSLGSNEQPTLFGTSTRIAEGDSRYEYVPGRGFGAPEALPLHLAASAWQDFFFEFPNGRGARVVRTWLDASTAGLHVTTRSSGQWTREERVTPFGASDTEAPRLSYAGADLLLFWENDERVALRAHDGTGWGAEVSPPRSRALEIEAVAGSTVGSALLVGKQVIAAENVALTKLQRRGDDGTWYCAELHPPAPTIVVASSGAGQYAVALGSGALRVARFEP